MPDQTYRRDCLLNAIRTHGRPVTTGLAERLLAGTWPTYGRRTAWKDLRALARRGHLVAADVDGRRIYRPTAGEDGRS